MQPFDATLLPKWIKDYRYLDEVDSTNAYAATWADKGASHGSLVIAELQTSGRGRLNRSWHSEPGASLTFSLILRPSEPGLTNLIAAVSLCDSIESLRIKWPNDLMIAGKKVAGMLSEATSERVVLGIGVNVNEVGFPQELDSIATSLLLAEGRPRNRWMLLSSFLTNLQANFDRPRALVLERYRSLCDTLGKTVRVELGARSVHGVAHAVDDDGALMLSDGTIVKVGDVIHLR